MLGSEIESQRTTYHDASRQSTEWRRLLFTLIRVWTFCDPNNYNLCRPRNADWHKGDDNLEHLARSYLDANCGHCHNPDGAADTSGLWLDYQAHPDLQLGICKPPIAAGSGSGGHLFSIVPGAPEASIMLFRMATENPATRMPELGRDVAHVEGVEVVSDWIASLDGACR